MIGASEILSLVAIGIASVGASFGWKSHKRSLMLGMPASSLFLHVIADDQEALSLNVTDDGPWVNRLISYGLVFASGDYAPMNPESAGITDPIAPGEKVDEADDVIEVFDLPVGF